MEGQKEITFIGLIKELNLEQVRYLIIGRRAVILYGAPVMTADYDLWIDRSEKIKALKVFERLNCELSHPPETEKPIVFAFSGMKKFDLFFYRSITNIRREKIEFNKCFDSSELIEDPAESVFFRIPAIDDLIKMKMVRDFNAKDELDIEYLQKARQLRKKIK